MKQMECQAGLGLAHQAEGGEVACSKHMAQRVQHDAPLHVLHAERLLIRQHACSGNIG